jgi:hypothetical protein
MKNMKSEIELHRSKRRAVMDGQTPGCAVCGEPYHKHHERLMKSYHVFVGTSNLDRLKYKIKREVEQYPEQQLSEVVGLLRAMADIIEAKILGAEVK